MPYNSLVALCVILLTSEAYLASSAAFPVACSRLLDRDVVVDRIEVVVLNFFHKSARRKLGSKISISHSGLLRNTPNSCASIFSILLCVITIVASKPASNFPFHESGIRFLDKASPQQSEGDPLSPSHPL